MNARRSSIAVVGAALTLAGVAGCSQISALAPVGGDTITTLRIAADDVLLSNDVDILIAPKCKEDGAAYRCEGTTVDGQPITVTSPAGKPRTMTVTVGSTVLYDGDVSSVVEKAAEAGS